jgi:alkaline phosphatase
MSGVALGQVMPEGPTKARDNSEKPLARIGLLTDIHYADKPAPQTRHYRDSLSKVHEAVDHFNTQKVDCIIELGDFIDSGESKEAEIAFLKRVDAEYSRFPGERHYVLGNHDVSRLTKQQFLTACGKQKSHYSFDCGSCHLVVLDACFRPDGVDYLPGNFKWSEADIPAAQRDWLREDLKASNKPTVICVHQRLDEASQYAIRSAATVRQILEESRTVVAVLQGHSHKNDYQVIEGIHYVTLRAVVEGAGLENSGYGIFSLYNGSHRLNGFRKQQSYRL